jgi:hypothetical protein
VLLFFRVTLCADSSAPRALDVADLCWCLPGEVDPADMPPADRAMLARLRGGPV